MTSVSKIVVPKPNQSNLSDINPYYLLSKLNIDLGKIVTAYNEGQCEISAAHNWLPGDELFWQKDDNGKVITCNDKSCFEAQGGKADGEINVPKEVPEPAQIIEKNTGIHKEMPKNVESEIAKNDADIHGPGEKPKPAPKVREMDVTDFAAKAMYLEYLTYAKEIKIIQKALRDTFPEARGDEIGMKTKLLWDTKHK